MLTCRCQLQVLAAHVCVVAGRCFDYLGERAELLDH
jgi:hypothetical protein